METKYDIGMIGLGVMGRNLALNIADQGYSVFGMDKDGTKVDALREERTRKTVQSSNKMNELVAGLKQPRVVILLVPAGKPVDSVIGELSPLLSGGDLIIDAGNSHFKDTDIRAKALKEKGLHFFGMGVSGGELGARHGPSLMPGGPREAFETVKPILESIAAKVSEEPCVAYLGPGSAGHYVKMVHNGIEYGLMQLIAESYDLLHRGLGFSEEELHTVFLDWNKTELSSYLIEITSQIFSKKDKKTGEYLVDLILDVARQKGTGKWASQDAMDLQVPIPTIDAAVAMRDLSTFEVERQTASRTLTGPEIQFRGPRDEFVSQLKNGLYAAMILSFAQGMSLLRKASVSYAYELHLETVAKIWRGGCIIRASLLEKLAAAFAENPTLPNILLDPEIGKLMMDRQTDLRTIVRTSVDLGIPAPGLMSALSYYDGYRTQRLPANLTQAQRDFFGSHTYERTDEKGVFHTQWT